MSCRFGGPAAAAARVLATLAATTSTIAVAQPVDPPATTVPPAPVATRPAPSPFTAPAPQAPLPLVANDGPATITRVQIEADGAGSHAIPPAGWTPPADPSGTIRLAHKDGQPLDAAWVQQQFDAATAAGAIVPSTAVALVQLINRAFVTAGFINSGLLVTDRGRNSGVLDVRLVYGQLGTPGERQPPVTVEWGDKKARGLSADYIRARFPSASAQPLNALELERDFRLLDESPAIRSISAALRPGTHPGEASLHLVVHPAEQFDFYTGASNDRSPAVGDNHLFAGGFARNLLRSGDLLTFEGGVTRGVKDGQLGYAVPLFWPALSLNLRGSFNNAAVITNALLPLDIRARDRSFEAGLSYEIARSPLMVRGADRHWSASESLIAGLSVVGRRQRSYLLGEPFSFAPGSVNGRSEYEALRLSGDYVRRDLNRVIALSLSGTVGLDGTRSDIAGIPNPKRHFGALLGQVNVAQRIPAGFEVRGRLTGQFSNGPLYSGLRLSIGGADSVRGYRESLYLVDRGLIGSVELAHSLDLSGERPQGGFGWGAFSASVFADGAIFRNAVEPQPDKRRIASVGVGLAWTPSDAVRASIAYGHALTDAASSSGKRSLQDRGIHFRIIVHPAGII